MCGRYTISTNPREIAATFGLQEVPDPEGSWERFNVAPTQEVPAVRADAEDKKTRSLALLKWGLIPSWAKEAKIGNSLINARGETVATKHSFRSAFKKRRCLIVMDGFYEWDKLGAGSTKGKKQPWHFRLKGAEPFGVAGLWEWWRDPTGPKDADGIESCTIITTEANELLAPIHDRMPVILHHKDFARWLDPEYANVETLEKLLVPFEAKTMESVAVSTAVNSPRNQGKELLEPVEVRIASDALIVL